VLTNEIRYSKDRRMNQQDAVAEALTEFVELAGDRSLIRPAGALYRRLASAIDPIVVRDGGVDLALMGMYVGDIRVESILLITPTSVAVVFERGMFKKKVDVVEVARSAITTTSVGRGSGATSRARLLTITTTVATTRVALPVQSPAVEQRLEELLGA